MGRYCGAVCRLCRREGEKLFLKGERCYTNKCAIERREGGPGQHGKTRQAYSDFKIQLRAKQKARRMYGVAEKQFRKLFGQALKVKGVAGTEFLKLLERRLDNIVYRAGFASSRREARQLVSHGHILVKGKPVKIASYILKEGDDIQIREKSKKLLCIQSALSSAEARIIPEWIALDKSNLKATLQAIPSRDQMPQSINEQLIVEMYSR